MGWDHDAWSAIDAAQNRARREDEERARRNAERYEAAMERRGRREAGEVIDNAVAEARRADLEVIIPGTVPAPEPSHPGEPEHVAPSRSWSHVASWGDETGYLPCLADCRAKLEARYAPGLPPLAALDRLVEKHRA